MFKLPRNYSLTFLFSGTLSLPFHSCKPVCVHVKISQPLLHLTSYRATKPNNPLAQSYSILWNNKCNLNYKFGVHGNKFCMLFFFNTSIHACTAFVWWREQVLDRAFWLRWVKTVILIVKQILCFGNNQERYSTKFMCMHPYSQFGSCADCCKNYRWFVPLNLDFICQISQTAMKLDLAFI